MGRLRCIIPDDADFFDCHCYFDLHWYFCCCICVMLLGRDETEDGVFMVREKDIIEIGGNEKEER